MMKFSSPFIEERLYLKREQIRIYNRIKFSSPFIEERLYLIAFYECGYNGKAQFSSPFIEERLYFKKDTELMLDLESSRPLLSRSGCISYVNELSSTEATSSRPLLSRSGCIFNGIRNKSNWRAVLVPFYRGAVVFNDDNNYGIAFYKWFSSPFIEERLYFKKNKKCVCQ